VTDYKEGFVNNELHKPIIEKEKVKSKNQIFFFGNPIIFFPAIPKKLKISKKGTNQLKFIVHLYSF